MSTVRAPTADAAATLLEGRIQTLRQQISRLASERDGSEHEYSDVKLEYDRLSARLGALRETLMRTSQERAKLIKELDGLLQEKVRQDNERLQQSHANPVAAAMEPSAAEPKAAEHEPEPEPEIEAVALDTPTDPALPAQASATQAALEAEQHAAQAAAAAAAHAEHIAQTQQGAQQAHAAAVAQAEPTPPTAQQADAAAGAGAQDAPPPAQAEAGLQTAAPAGAPEAAPQAAQTPPQHAAPAPAHEAAQQVIHTTPPPHPPQRPPVATQAPRPAASSAPPPARSAPPAAAASAGNRQPFAGLQTPPRAAPPAAGPQAHAGAVPGTAPAAAPPPRPAAPVGAPAGSIQDRKKARVPLAVEVDFSSENNLYVGFSEDISEGGLFVATYAPRPVGERLSLQFKLPGQGRVMTVDTVVAWSVPQREDHDGSVGMGLRFVNLTEEDRRALTQFIAQREPLFFPGES